MVDCTVLMEELLPMARMLFESQESISYEMALLFGFDNVQEKYRNVDSNEALCI